MNQEAFHQKNQPLITFSDVNSEPFFYHSVILVMMSNNLSDLGGEC